MINNKTITKSEGEYGIIKRIKWCENYWNTKIEWDLTHACSGRVIQGNITVGDTGLFSSYNEKTDCVEIELKRPGECIRDISFFHLGQLYGINAMGYTTNMGQKGAVGVYAFTYEHWKKFYQETKAVLDPKYYKVPRKNDTEVCLSSVGIKLGLAIYDARGGFNVEAPTYASNVCEKYREGLNGGVVAVIVIILLLVLCCVAIFAKKR